MKCPTLGRATGHDDAFPVAMPGAKFGTVRLFWLDYCHPDGRFAGAAVIEASTLVSARMTAAVYGLNDQLKFASGHELDEATAHEIPENMIGRLLDDRDLRRLQHFLMPRKSPAPSVRRRKAARKISEG
jgi:hypothetical protein